MLDNLQKHTLASTAALFIDTEPDLLSRKRIFDDRFLSIYHNYALIWKRKLETNNIPTEEEYNRLLEYLKTKKNKDYYFFIKVLGTTGARLSEFMQFTWEDIISGEVTLKGKGNKYRRFFFQDQLRKEAKAFQFKRFLFPF